MARCRRQLHVWVSDADHEFLNAQAAENETTVGAIVRGLIKQSLRQQTQRSPSVMPSSNETINRKAPEAR